MGHNAKVLEIFCITRALIKPATERSAVKRSQPKLWLAVLTPTCLCSKNSKLGNKKMIYRPS